MKKISFVITACVLSLLLSNCSKKTTPAKDPVVAAPVKKIKTTVPKVITVNDASAKKNFDGRLYYDLEGHRYWRNNNDGKYYLYNKSMQSDDAYKVKKN
jgi:hypothetical protein